MKKIRTLAALWLGVMALLIAGVNSPAQSANTSTNTPALTGQFAELARLALKSDEAGALPAKLSGLLWPDAAKHSYKVQKLSMPDKAGERFFLLRTDNHHDVVLVHRTENQPNETTKYRKDFYYRATMGGDLVLALSAKFRFEIDDVDNELLKDLTFQPYGGGGTNSQPMTSDVQKKFETEKKYWLGVQKKLAKTLRRKEKSE
jgi:hypothetical protein